MQTKASDQWAYFQAKNIRLHEMQIAADMLATLAPGDKENAGPLHEKHLPDAERNARDKDQFTEQASSKKKGSGGST